MSEQALPSKNRSPRYDTAIKLHAVEQVLLYHQTVAQVAGQLQCSPQSVANWVKQHQNDISHVPGQVTRYQNDSSHVANQATRYRNNISHVANQSSFCQPDKPPPCDSAASSSRPHVKSRRFLIRTSWKGYHQRIAKITQSTRHAKEFHLAVVVVHQAVELILAGMQYCFFGHHVARMTSPRRIDHLLHRREVRFQRETQRHGFELVDVLRQFAICLALTNAFSVRSINIS